MSDTFYQPSEEELLMQLLSAQQYGADPASTYINTKNPFQQQEKKLNYIKKIADMVGVPFMQLLGVADPVEEAPQVNEVRSIYGNNPAFAKAFDAIDAGYDPYSVTAAYLEDAQADPSIGGIDPAEYRAIAEKYAAEKAKMPAASSGYTKADGSKWDAAPLGGNDVLGSASEFELMGAPSQSEVLSLIARQRQAREAEGGSGFTPLSAQRQIGSPATAPGVDTGELIGRWAGASRPKLANDPAVLQSLLKAAPGGQYNGQTLVGGIGNGSGDKMRSNAEKVYQDQVKLSAKLRTNKAQGTLVRSDANNNLMRRLLAVQSLLGA